ncbi:hypothetical protein C1M56_20605 [Vibrio diazotrophicus]|nr:hypothetical protein C1M56_20605 [Vibrio diazotrophicus]
MKNTGSKPALVSIDWHQDLCEPVECEKEELDRLDLASFKEVVKFSWEKLNPLNDGHILAAAYLGFIGDIYVLCKQDIESKFTEFVGRDGEVHKIHCFYDKEELMRSLRDNEISELYLDIDLDYFTESSDPCGGGDDLTVMDTSQIQSVIDPQSEVMLWCFKRLQGMTLATEPEFCGGVRNSNYIFDTIDRSLFSAPLMGTQATWRHLIA